ncbi:MAG: tRNA 2-thiouridine(34) synthase MnmA [Peptococcaceae bacterium]|nr:tRNA 2-thiouridine(34) synthase MnmA [Peptococcaceae bacterium]
MNKGKIVLGMSGGVDSSVCVHLLQQMGYTVIGLHLQLIEERFTPNSSGEADARQVAEQFGIEFHTLDIRQNFTAKIINYFADEYINGRTPNPCVICNQMIKMNYLEKFADEIGAEWIATGHYVQLTESENGQRLLARGIDEKKDQSYFLSLISPKLLKRLQFPLGQYTKSQVREIAEGLGMKVASKSDSQEICFITDNDYKSFLARFLPPKSFKTGAIMHSDGRKLGKHTGLANYTIGQRKGLGVALGEPAYVVALDKEKNQVVLGSNEELMKNALLAVDNQFYIEVPLQQPVEVQAKVRYRTQPAAATLYRHNEHLVQVEFQEAQRAITPGQCVCYYQGEQVIGGGIIESVLE